MQTNPSKTVDELLAALSFIVDIEGNKKLYHAWRVAILATKFAHRLKANQQKHIFYACLMHDFGAVGLTRHITHFLKNESKIGTALPLLLSHPLIGAQLISTLPNINAVSRLIMGHHEWFNGLGYPMGKSAGLIPRGAQLIRAADSIDITLRWTPYAKLNTVARKIRAITNKEISSSVAKLAINELKKNNFLNSVADLERIRPVFQQIKNKIEPLHMTKGIDAIGRTLEVIAQIIDMKHPFTSGHSVRVSRYAMAISLALKLKHDDITRIKWAGLIHDIGKLSIPRSILSKPAKLTKKEFSRVRKHPEMTEKILGMVPSLQEITAIASGHHEYYDGTGYPRGLEANESMLGARILTICDAFDAMTSNRPYRYPLSPKDACKEIKKLSGKQFDPQIAKVALPLFKNLGL